MRIVCVCVCVFIVLQHSSCFLLNHTAESGKKIRVLQQLLSHFRRILIVILIKMPVWWCNQNHLDITLFTCFRHSYINYPILINYYKLIWLFIYVLIFRSLNKYIHHLLYIYIWNIIVWCNSGNAAVLKSVRSLPEQTRCNFTSRLIHFLF